MVYRGMKRWSVMPQKYIGSRKMPRVTYIVPMTPAASAAQVALMQNQNQMQMNQMQDQMKNGMKHNYEIEHAVDDANEKADTAFEIAAHTQEQIDEHLGQNQGIMFLLIASFLILFIFLK
jgi:hypothetical protein